MVDLMRYSIYSALYFNVVLSYCFGLPAALSWQLACEIRVYFHQEMKLTHIVTQRKQRTALKLYVRLSASQICDQ